MSKRFTDTEIWDREWFMNLSLKHKCLIRFLFDKCDVAGVWSANWMLASSYIGEKVSEDDLEFLSEHVAKLSPGKFYLVDFIEFQYGTLSEKCKPHIKIIALLKKYGLYKTEFIGYTKGIQTLEEEEEEKEKETETDEGGVGETAILSKKILQDFGFTETANFDKLRIISTAVREIISSGRLEYFSQQYRDYWAYKRSAKERTHNLVAFFGDPPGWDSANWGQKLKDHIPKNEPNKTDKATQIINTHDNVNRILQDTYGSR